MKPKHASFLAFLLAAVFVTVSVLAGALLKIPFSNFDGKPLFLILIGAFILICTVNRKGAVAFARRRFAMDDEERHRWLTDERRDACEKDPDSALAELGNLSVLPISLLILYGLFVVGISVSLGLASFSPTLRTVFLMPILHLFAAPIYNRLLLARGRLHREELVPEGEMPHIREMAERAARAAGIKGHICLQTISDKDISVKRFGKTYLVFLGTRALAVASEEELYAAILREFVYYTDPRIDRRARRYDCLASLGSAKPRGASWVFDLFFSPADVYMEWNTIFYKLAMSRKLDRMAADTILGKACARADLSMMAKQDMWDYFDHEWYTQITDSIFAHAEDPNAYEMACCDAYRRAMEQRYPVWRRMLGQKIPSAYYVGASLDEQCRLLGLTLDDIPEVPAFPSPDTLIGRECLNPSLRSSRRAKHYEEIRQNDYFESLKTVTEWEASDRDQPAYELSAVLNAYHSLHRIRDVEALCDRILTEEPDFAHAVYLKGLCRLQRYETTGIDDIYRAIDLNKNYMHDGFEQIETYCRLTGLEDELNALLRRRETVVNANAAEQNEAGILRATDRLVKETELDTELPAILAYMAEAGDGCIDRIYLVRKVISEDFFTSCFVIDFAPGTDESVKRTAYTTIFHYLDAAEWQYSLLIYNRDTEAAVKRVPDSLIWERRQ